MKSLVCFFSLTALISGYLDLSVVKVDRRFNNDEGYINPYKFFRRTIVLLSNLPPKSSNTAAWNKFHNFLQKTYSPENATRIEKLATTISDTINMLPEIAQSLAIGLTIDGWNSLFPYGPRQPSTATVQGVTAWQMFQMNIRQVIYPEFNSMFYNPFDTEMIATLNNSDVLTFKMNLFKYFNMMAPYRGSYAPSPSDHYTLDHSSDYFYYDYNSQPDSYKYSMKHITSKKATARLFNLATDVDMIGSLMGKSQTMKKKEPLSLFTASRKEK